ncbi:MAG: aspartate aminotransferase family protein [Hyphomicrobiales bacterium]|nr:MAG: aspartate aminotransferase family protein [Hyphomicrobiales bacterium]
MTAIDFVHWSNKFAIWADNYRKTLRSRPVRPNVQPGDISSQLPVSAPETPESMENIFKDFEDKILPGITHWQHPGFFAYFPANATPVSILAEQLCNAIAAQCMLWQTSPAATELETVTLDWLRQAVGLPAEFTGVIQDSASSATLAAVLTMRERALAWQGNTEGLQSNKQIRIYASDKAHTSIDRAIWISGIGSDNLVRIPVNGELGSMDIDALKDAINKDREAGFIPAGIIANVGATSIGSTDQIKDVATVAESENLYLHVDAAWAGSAMICPEFRHLWAGVEKADSVVFNPHKWLGVQFDCSAHYIREPEALVKTLAIQPEYLKTHGKDGFVNYSEWSVPLGRRFRALKLWFVLRAYGLEHLRTMIRNHVSWSMDLANRLDSEPDFELTSKPVLSLFAFRYVPKGAIEAELEDINQNLLNNINDDGRIYLTQTKIGGMFMIRFQAGSVETTEADVKLAGDIICELARNPV